MSSRCFGRSIIDLVSRCRAATLEGMVESAPVTSFMGERLQKGQIFRFLTLTVGEKVYLAQVVIGGCAPGNSGEEQDDTIVLGLGRVIRWEGSISQEARRIARFKPNQNYTRLNWAYWYFAVWERTL